VSRRRLLSQLAHVELQSPDPDTSIKFFTDVLGLSVTTELGQSAFLRGWGEHFHHSLVITEGPQPYLSHIAWRAAGEEELEIAVKRLEDLGVGEGWEEATTGHGPAYRYRSPGGHLHEILWEVDRYEAPADQRSSYPIRPQKFNPVGCAARSIDHVTIGSGVIPRDIEFYCETFGSRYMECTQFSADDDPFFAEISNTEQAHDLGLIWDGSGHNGRSHHVAYWLDNPVDLVRAADVLSESGNRVEFGPGKHGHGENSFLYVRDPGSKHRVELFSGGYRNYEPDWETRRWVGGVSEAGGNDMFRSSVTPDAMRELFPPVDDAPLTALPDAPGTAVPAAH
jgi:catechol 2,3-dioxygenase